MNLRQRGPKLPVCIALIHASYFSFAERQGWPREVKEKLAQLSHWELKADHSPSLGAVFSSADWMGKAPTG